MRSSGSIPRYNPHGFSLIEVMAALAILGVGVVAIIHGLSGSMEARRRVEDRAIAFDLLQLKMKEYANSNQDMQPISGKFETPFENYMWTVTIVPTGLAELRELSVKVSWEGRRGPRIVQQRTLVPQQ